MSQMEKRVKNIKDSVSMTRVLKEYKLYPFTYQIDDFQMKCPFHGGGKENRASAHVYKDKTFTCFTCEKNNFDVIEFIKEREQIEDFFSLLSHIEKKFGLAKVAYDPEDDFYQPTPEEAKALGPSLQDLHKHLEWQIMAMKKSLSLHRFSNLFYLIDRAESKKDMALMKQMQAKVQEFKAEIEANASS